MTPAQQLKLAYAEAVAQLRLHPTLIWTRNNFFLLINSGLLAFAISDAGQKWRGSPLLVPLAGIFLSLIWIWVNWAGQHLQRQWRGLVLDLEKELFKPKEGESAIQGPFTQAASRAKEGTSWAVSITTALIVLSLGFLGCWGYFLILALKPTACAH